MTLRRDVGAVLAPLLLLCGSSFADPADESQTRAPVSGQTAEVLAKVGVPADVNGQIEVVDLVDWLSDYTRGLELVDADADGAVDMDDARIAIVELLQALHGDLNFDGVVDAADAAWLAEQLKMRDGDRATAREGDVNADGILSGADLVALLENLGSTVDHQELSHVANQMLEFIASADGPGDHGQYFSDTFPPEWPGPPFFPPFPPNHEYSISEQWYQNPPFGPPAPGHQIGTSQNGWPPNHYWQISVSWPIEHTIDVSDIEWPPNHVHEISTTWPPTHTATLSGQFPPNHILPNSYNESHLQIWSILHPDDPHMIPEPSPHRAEVSNHWADHQVAESLLVWPPNHIRQASLSWRHDHLLNVSITWPTGHYGGVSRLWPQPTPPWPPNHLVSASNEGGGPHVEPIPPLFPPDHTIFTTIRDIPNLIPDISDDASNTKSVQQISE